MSVRSGQGQGERDEIRAGRLGSGTMGAPPEQRPTVSTNDRPGPSASESSRHPASQSTGLLHVEFDYPLDGLEELHDWYNTEHIPERVSIPGFVTGRRFAAIEGSPRWSAIYELETPAVLETPAYSRFKGADETVWTKRILLTSRPSFRRSVFELLSSAPGATDTRAPGPPGLFSLRLTGLAPADDSDLRALLAAPGVRWARLYRDLETPSEHLFLADLGGIWAVQSPEFREAWARLASNLAEQSVAYARGVHAVIL
jgi:hypothetical protein